MAEGAPEDEDVRARARLTVQHRLLRETMMRTFGVGGAGRPAFNSRLKHALNQGLSAASDPSCHGRGSRRRYTLLDTFNVGLCLQLQRAFVDPAIAAAFILAEQSQLGCAWRNAIGTLGPRWLEVELNAFATMEKPEIAIGRRGAARIASGEPPPKGVQPPPRLNVDLSALVNRIGAALILAGISPSAMAAELALRAL